MRLLASGRDADVYELDSATVLRRYRNGRSMASEAAVIRHAASCGYPVPAVSAVTEDGMVMERLHGPTMLDALVDGSVSTADGGALLGALLQSLARIPYGDGQLLHLDLHPGNVILTERGPVVIDWSNAESGPSTLDVAMSGLIVAEVAVGSIPEAPVSADTARSLLRALLATTGPADPDQVAVALTHRRRNPTLSAAEKDLLPAAARLLAG